MHRRVFLTLAGGTALSSFPHGVSAAPPSASGRKPEKVVADPSWSAKLEEILHAHKIPGLAAAHFDLEGLKRCGTAGVRKAGSPQAVTVEDLWHIGSMTKAMTATLLATYVQEGKLAWEDTLGKLLPEACRKASPAARDITLRQLLHHRSGLPANLPSWWDLPEARQRGKILELAAPKDKELKVPGPYLYSNVGYALAGHVAEKLERGLWEDLLQKRVFSPLQMKPGQGPAGREGKLDQPWPHDHDGRPLPSNGPRSDNPPSLGPAGRVHATLQDYCRFGANHLQGAKGDTTLLKAAQYQFLHAPDPDSGYAGGWNVTERPWAGGRCLTHNGSNNGNFFVAWLAPAKSFGVVAACNQGGPVAAKALDEACSHLIRELTA